MDVPVELRRRPPPETLAWTAAQIGPQARVTRVRRLRNAWAAAVHAIDVEHGDTVHRLVLRRWARPELPPDPGVVANEAAALELLAGSGISAPRLVASDADGAATDVPALLMTRLPGHDVLAPRDLAAYLDGLAATLHRIHDVHVPIGVLEVYDPWLPGAPPPGRLWEHAYELAHASRSRAGTTLCHRDYHPGNTLWRRGRLVGVVDWAHACRGPAAADVAHCRVNLALLFGLDAADTFAARYGPVAELASFDLTSAVSAHGIVDELWRFHDAGRTDLTRALATERIDAFVARAVSSA